MRTPLASPFGHYPAYKPSGVPWLGDLPEHWDVAQLGRIGIFSKGSGGTKDDEVPDGIPCVRYGDLYTTHTHFIKQTRSYVSPAKASAYTPINRGDVLFPTSGETIEEIGKSAVNLMHAEVLCGGDLIIFRPTIPMEPKFAGYALDCPAAQTQKSLMGRGITIMHIYSSQLKYLWLPLPPLPEQAAIVRYLDYVDRRIRRYVTAKRKLVGLLEEEKRAIVNQAVTRGLDPNVRLKPSGVEWLGDVPAHWEVLPNKGVLELKKETVGDKADKYTLLSLTKQGIIPRNLEVAKGKYPASFDTYQVVVPGDLIFCLFDIDETPRTVGISTEEGMVTGAYTRFVCVDETTARFAYLLYLSLDDRKALRPLYSGLRKVIATQTFLGAKLALPPANERATIIEHVEKAIADIEAAIAHARRQIELAQEYRTRLIADVVTGKLDVREAAAQLPDESDEEGPIDRDGLVLDNIDDGSSDVSQLLEEEQTMESEVIA